MVRKTSKLALACACMSTVAAQNLPLFSLAYGYADLEPHIDEATMRVHHLGHTKTYTDNVNKVLASMRANATTHTLAKQGLDFLLAHLHMVPPEYNEPLRNNGGGYINHELYFGLLSPPTAGDIQADGSVVPHTRVDEASALGRSIAAKWGSWDQFKTAFKASALSVFGSGWTWLVYDSEVADTTPGARLRIENTRNQDSPVMFGARVPIIGLDVWEHAYYLQHQ